MVTMKEIARIAHVSQQAVSAALSGTSCSRVSEETRRKILRIAEDLHYVPNAASRILKGGRSHLIGLFSSVPYFGIAPDIMREFSLQMRQAGYDLLSAGDFEEKSPEEIRKAVLLMESRGVEGIAVLFGNRFPEPDFFHVPHLLMRTGDNSDIDIDSRLGSRLAVEHLLFHGRHRLAYLASNLHDFHPRLQTWRKVLEENHLYDPALSLTVQQFPGGEADLIRELIRLKVDGIVAHNDQLAAKLIVLLLRSGIRVPEDIAVIGYDGQSFCDVCRVPLATVLQPARQLARRAAELFLERLDRQIINAPPAGILLKPVLRPSESCGCPPPPGDPLNPVNTFRLLDSHNRFSDQSDQSDKICVSMPEALKITPNERKTK